MTASKDESMTSETTPETTPETVPAAGDEASAAADIASEKDAARGLRPGQSAKSFWPSTKRLVREMGPEKTYLFLAIAVGVISVAFSVVGPRILGRATDLIFTGIISKELPAGADPADVIAQLRADGQDQFADMLSGMTLTPGEGIDFAALYQTLGLAVGLFAIAALLMWLQGLALNRIIYRMVSRLRRDVEEKLHRLPLAYFDRMKRGEILSRVTNDIDNIQNTLMNTVTGLVNSILMVVGVLVMMLTISWQLSLIALAVIPVALVVTGMVGKQAQKLFAQQWDATGVVNSEVEEAYTGHGLVTVFGRRDEVAARFEERNETLFRATFGAQFVSSLIMPLMMFVGNLSYVAVAIVGGLRIISGQLTLGDVQA
ncbi:MAG TPA: ABC transporter ATP-binding protein, partial [Brachybacterium massiliense]|nr:ABC transporter ATP-binding protein [Brachybacterium massiliense]